MKRYPILLIPLLLMVNCQYKQQSVAEEIPTRNLEAREDSVEFQRAVEARIHITNALTANAETHPVLAAEHDDAADDPAFWYNSEKPENSLIFGTNKKDGVYSYTIKGTETGYYPLGKVNNIDIRQGMVYAGDTVDILAGSNRSDNSIIIYRIEKSGSISPFKPNHLIDTTIINEVYGFCLYQDISGRLYYIVNGKNGVIHAYHFLEAGDELEFALWKSWKLNSQPEGMVADDVYGWLYVGEEEKGIWKIDLNDGRSAPVILPASQAENNPNIRYDIEGLSIYYGEDNNGFLIASSQGNFSYALFDRISNEFIWSFKILDSDLTDGVEETDGLEVFSGSLGDIYPEGIIIFQDGFNYDGDQLKSQNFKILDIRKILDLLETVPNT
jgi:3-phytase